MEAVPRGIDPDWHECNLLILLMNTGPMPRKELLERVREEQSRKKMLGEDGITHSRRAHVHWLKEHIADRIAIESEGQPRLTPLGQWIANSEIGTLNDRYSFICNITCHGCRRRDGLVVVLKADMSTAVVGARERLYADTECPRCGNRAPQRRVYEGCSVGQFSRFYVQAVSELAGVAKEMPELILPAAL